MALKAVELKKVEGGTSALSGNMSNNILALIFDMIQLATLLENAFNETS